MEHLPSIQIWCGSTFSEERVREGIFESASSTRRKGHPGIWSLPESRMEKPGQNFLIHLLGIGGVVEATDLIAAFTNAPLQAEFPAAPPGRKLLGNLL
jgi:hypothetical protein